jgi:scyllo-inositol 2-dehydrogenase (NADP+)
MTTPIRVGITGFGMAAKVMHVPFLLVNKNYQIVAVLERHKEESKAVIPDVKVVKTIEELIAIHDIDLIVITTPNDTHFTYAEKALLAGKHVVVDKPFTNTVNEAKVLIEVARRQGKTLSVFQNRRYVADFLTVKKVLDEKLLGDVIEYIAHYDRYRPEIKQNAWREEGKLGSGILYDLGAHIIDQALVLFGLPKRLYADVRMQRPGAKTDDYFELQLYYDFTKVVLHASMYVREHGPRFQIHGTKGSFIKCGEDVQEDLLKQGIAPISEDWGRDPIENYGVLHTEKGGKVFREFYPSVQGSFGLYYNNLYETLVNGKPLQERPEQSYNVIKLIELAFLSNKKKAVVDCEGFLVDNN